MSISLADGQPIKNFCFFPKSVYRWIKGDDEGTEEIVTTFKDGFLEFKSGRKCNLEILHEYMDPISAGPDPIEEAQKRFNILTAGLAEEPEIPKELKEKFKIEDQQNQEVVQEKPIVIDNINQLQHKSPIRLVLENQQSTQNYTLHYSIDVAIPDKDITGILIKSFPTPDGQVINEIIQIAKEKLNIQEITNQLHKLIEDQLKNHYNTL